MLRSKHILNKNHKLNEILFQYIVFRRSSCFSDKRLDCPAAERGAHRDWLVVLSVRGINGKCFLVATRCLCLPTLSGTLGFKQTRLLSSCRENTKTSVGLHFFICRGKKTEARNSKSFTLAALKLHGNRSD